MRLAAAAIAAFLVLFLRAVSHHVPAPTINASAGTTVASAIWAPLLNCPLLSLPFVDTAGAPDVVAEYDEDREPLLVVGSTLVPDAEAVVDVVAGLVDDAIQREYPSAP